MTHTFNRISANPTFGSIRENLYQSDYINKKKGSIIFCKTPLRCQKPSVVTSYNMLNLFNTDRRYQFGFQTNKNNLIIGQYTKENLNNVCTVSAISPYSKPEPCSSDSPCNPCQNSGAILVNDTLTFYNNYMIDPLGELFGQTQCGELNYTEYMECNPPFVKS